MLKRSIFAIAFGSWVALFALFTLLATPSLSEDSGSTLAPSISAAELHSRRESPAAPVIIDVRTPEEYASGHIPGAVNIPFHQIAERIGGLSTPNGVALYCMIGPRARKGESALQAAGYQKILHLEGGLAAWQAAGLAITGEK